MAETYDITIKRGAMFRRVFTIKDSANNPINLTGATAVVKLIPKGLSPIDCTATITNPTGGQVTLSISDETTATFTSWKSGRWYFNIGYSNGDVEDYLEGAVTLTDLGG
jgi:hypothetical protein